MNNQKFDIEYVFSADYLHQVVKADATFSQLSYYLIVNSWEDVCKTFEAAALTKRDVEGIPFSIIDIMDVPNCLEVMKSAIREVKDTINTSALNNYSQLPMLVVLHGAFPRAVTYNGSISTELGV